MGEREKENWKKREETKGQLVEKWRTTIQNEGEQEETQETKG